MLFTEKPGRPDTPLITGTDDSSVALKWTPPASDGGSPIFNYIIEYRSIGSYKWIQANTDKKVPELTYSVQKLKKGAEYEFRIAAENRAGVGEFSPPTEPVKVVKPLCKFILNLILLKCVVYFCCT